MIPYPNAVNTLLVVENVDDLKPLLHKFQLTSKKSNIEILVENTENLTIFKIPHCFIAKCSVRVKLLYLDA